VPESAVQHGLAEFGGFNDDVDVVIGREASRCRIETKSLLVRSGYKFFLVNERAHANSQRRAAAGYVFFAFAAGRREFVASRFVPIGDVSDWPVGVLPGHDDPAHRLGVGEFANKYMDGLGLPDGRNPLAGVSGSVQLITEAKLEEMARASSQLPSTIGTTSTGHSPSDIVGWLNGLVREI
jgi:hypothetical protein